jgi:hypothetical protein
MIQIIGHEQAVVQASAELPCTTPQATDGMDIHTTPTRQVHFTSPSIDSQFWHRPNRSQVEVPAGRREEATAGPKARARHVSLEAC